VRGENRKVLGNKRFQTDVADIGRYFQRMTTDTDERLSFALEATGFYFWIYDCIVALGHAVLVVHPTKVKPLMRAKAKNDKNDAATLAELLEDAGGDLLHAAAEAAVSRSLTSTTCPYVRQVNASK
jgi:transposase